MSDQPRLSCASCGSAPTELEARYTAKPNGTHYRKLTHAAGVPGREQAGKVRSCGPWVLAGATKEEREKAVQVWRERER